MEKNSDLVKEIEELESIISNLEKKKGKKGKESLAREEKFENLIKKYKEKIDLLKEEIGKIVVGQREVVNSVLVCLICDGHALLEGVPGLAKSLLVEVLGRTIEGTTYRRIQFVPDMLPADLLGVNTYNPKTGEFYIIKGPVFANFILADEINRAPPKTQAAMLECMQERKVNIAKQEFILEKPFLVLATQNPLEQYGTYPLPEALVDRFFLKIMVYYPSYEEELEIIDRNTITNRQVFQKINKVIKGEEIIFLQKLVRKIYISDSIKKYILDIVNTTRKKTTFSFKELKYVKYGGSPRASIYLALGARANALLEGRTYVIPEDVKKVALEVLRHRIILNYEGKAEGITTDDIIKRLLEAVPVP